MPLLERVRLGALASQQQAPFEVVRRARIIELLAAGWGPAQVARAIGCSEQNVYKWRSRCEQSPSVDALHDAERSGRPATVSMQTRCRVVQLACARPPQDIAPFRTVWTQRLVIIWDNLNIHHDGPDDRWTRFNAERSGHFEFVYTPIHASWVNQIEQWFSIL